MPDVNLTLKLSPALEAGKLNVMIKALREALGPLGKDIKLIDVAKLKSDLYEVEKNFKDIDEQLKRTRSGLEDFGDGIERPVKRAQSLGKAFAFNQIYQSAQAVSGAVSQIAQPFIELDTQVRNIGTLGVEGFKEFGDLALEMSTRIPESAGAIAAGAYDALSAGIQGSNSEIMSFVEEAARLGVAGLTSTQEAVNGLTSILNAYKMSAADAGKVSDYLFNAVNAGKTTIPELNASLYNVVPTAAAFGVGIDEIAAALASMTKQGTPTSQATTQIRQALVEIAKPGTTLAPVLKAAGVSLESLKKEGLQASLVKIGDALKSMGLNASQAFGSVEAASAVMLLSGENAQLAAGDLDYVRNTVGSTAKAYDVASEGIAVKSKIWINTVQSYFNGVLGVLGSGAVELSHVASQLAPTLTAVGSIKNIIPEGAITKATGMIGSVLLPQIQRIAPSLVTVSQTGQVAFAGLGKAMLAIAANPVFLTIAAVAGLGMALNALSDALTTTAAERQEEIDAQKRMVEQDLSETRSKENSAVSTQKLAEEYSRLAREVMVMGENSSAAAAKKERLSQITDRLNETYPGAIKHTASLGDNIKAVEQIAKDSAASISQFRDRIKELESQSIKIDADSAKNQVQVAIEDMTGMMTSENSNIMDTAARFLGAGVVGLDAVESSAKEFVGAWAKGIQNSETKDQATDAMNAWIQQVQKDMEAGTIDASLAEKEKAAIKKIYDARVKAIEAEGKVAADQAKKSVDDIMAPAETAQAVKIKIEAQLDTKKLIADYAGARDEAAGLSEQLVKARSTGAKESVITDLSNQLALAQSKADGLAATIAGRMPEAVGNIKTVVDESGNLVTVYELNTDAANSMADANINAFGGETLKLQGEFDEKLKQQAQQLQSNRQELKNLANAIVAGRQNGENVDDLTKRYYKLKDQTDQTGQTLMDALKKGAAAGLDTKAVITMISTSLGIPKERLQEIIAKQTESKDKTKDMKGSVDSLAESWSKARSEAAAAIDKGTQALAEKLKKGEVKKGDAAYKSDRDNIKKLVKDEKEAAKIVEDLKKSTGQIEPKKGKSYYDRLKEEFDNQAKAAEAQARTKKAQDELARLVAGRERTTVDDIRDAQDALALQKSQLDVYKEKFAETKKLTAEQKKEVANEIAAREASIMEGENKVLELKAKIKIDDEKWKEELRKFEIEDFKLKIELGLSSYSDLQRELQKDLDTVNRELLTAEDDRAKELIRKRRELESSLRDVAKAAYEQEKDDLEYQLTLKENALNRELEATKAFYERYRAIVEGVGAKIIESEKNTRLKQLDDIRKADEDGKQHSFISDDEYNKRKDQIEAEASRKNEMLKNRIAGQEREATRENDLAALKQLQIRKESELELAKKNGDVDSQKRLARELDDVARQITEKSNVINASVAELGAGIGDGLSALFAGDQEGMKDNMRKTLATIAGFIEQAASAAVIQLLFTEGTISTLQALPFPLNILAMPVIKAVINGAVRAMLDPVLSGLMSFASGGRVDEPTLAVIGDAARLGGGSNTEWILRDDQFKAIVQEGMRISSAPQVPLLKAILQGVLELQNERLYVRGSDIYKSYGRSSAEISRRAR